MSIDLKQNFAANLDEKYDFFMAFYPGKKMILDLFVIFKI